MKKTFLLLSMSALCFMIVHSTVANEMTDDKTEVSSLAIDKSSSSVPRFTGYEYDGLPRELIVGQKGQIRRPADHYLAETHYSFILNSSNPDVLTFSENGEWIALKPGKTIVTIDLANPNTNLKFGEELKKLGLKTNWSIREIYVYPFEVTVLPENNPMYRLYNPNSGEHFYTVSLGEKTHLVSVGWSFEGIGWNAPSLGIPVYRLYNPNNGDHHYTTSKGEHDYLVTVGWHSENIGWQSGGEVPVYRLYNPNAKGAGSHHYTKFKSEADYLDSVGWNYEGIGWYGID